MRTYMRWTVGQVMAIGVALIGCGDSSQGQGPDPDSRGPVEVRELLVNPGFEAPGSPAPEGWFQEVDKTGTKGEVAADRQRFRSGGVSLVLRPNRRNGGDQPLAIAQVIPAAAYRGQKVEFSGYLRAEGGATAALGMLSIVGGRPANFAMVSQPGGGSDWSRQSQVYEVPDDKSVQLVLTCFVGGNAGAAWFDDVSVMPQVERGAAAATPAPAPSAPEAGPDAMKAAVRVNTRNVVRTIPRTLYGTNVEWIWDANGLWVQQQQRPHPEIVRLTKDMGVTLIRYPGGHFSDFYHWREGIGPRNTRPTVQHEPGKKDSTPITFGTDEALDFARQVDSELLITVNAGTGTAQEAADWVGYVKDKPQRVRFWEVGNELYINDGSEIAKGSTVGPRKYAKRYLEFARAMRQADPSIKIGAIGGLNQGRYAIVNYDDWNKIVLEQAGDQIDFLAVHNAYAPVVAHDSDKDVRTVYQAMLAAPVLIARNLDAISKQIERHAPDRAGEISIAVTEWGPAFMFDPRNRYVDHVKTLGSALFAASTLKTFIESPRTEIANFFLLNDMSVLGWIGSRNGEFPPKPDWAATARYYALQLFTRHFGDQLVTSTVEGPTYDSAAIGLVDAVKDVPYLDIVSSLSTDGETLYIMAVNKHFDAPIEASISLGGFVPTGPGTAWTLTGKAIDAHTGTTPLQIPGFGWAKQAVAERNSRFHQGGPDEISLSSAPVEGVAAEFTYSFPPHSVTSLILERGTSGK